MTYEPTPVGFESDGRMSRPKFMRDREMIAGPGFVLDSPVAPVCRCPAATDPVVAAGCRRAV
jgi:hypothetical protein